MSTKFKCNDCGKKFTASLMRFDSTKCPKCGSTDTKINEAEEKEDDVKSRAKQGDVAAILKVDKDRTERDDEPEQQKKLKEAIRILIRRELQMEGLSPFQKKVQAAFDRSGGTLSQDKVHSLIKGHTEEWSELVDKMYVGRKPGETIWRWV